VKTRFKKALLLALVSGFLLNGCFGGFVLTQKLYKWNSQFHEDKFIVNAVFWVMLVVPVYEAAGLVDFCFLNTIHFWTGKNPLTMETIEMEEQIVQKNGKTYKITASKNCYLVETLGPNGENIRARLFFNPQEKIWQMETRGRTITVAQVTGKNRVDLLLPNGERMVFEPEKKTSAGPAAFEFN